MIVNGCLRLIEIDDYFPVSQSNAQILARQQNKDEFGPALLEKAILKIYSPIFKSINTHPGIEMHHLIGWIPEIVRF